MHQSRNTMTCVPPQRTDGGKPRTASFPTAFPLYSGSSKKTWLLFISYWLWQSTSQSRNSSKSFCRLFGRCPFVSSLKGIFQHINETHLFAYSTNSLMRRSIFSIWSWSQRKIILAEREPWNQRFRWHTLPSPLYLVALIHTKTVVGRKLSPGYFLAFYTLCFRLD